MNNKCECCGKKKERSEEEYRKLINRLNRIEGQIRGIKGMVEKNAYCIDSVGCSPNNKETDRFKVACESQHNIAGAIFLVK